MDSSSSTRSRRDGEEQRAAMERRLIDESHPSHQGLIPAQWVLSRFRVFVCVCDSPLTAAPFDAPRPEAARSLERVDAARPEPRGALGDPLVEAYGAAAIDRKWRRQRARTRAPRAGSPRPRVAERRPSHRADRPPRDDRRPRRRRRPTLPLRAPVRRRSPARRSSPARRRSCSSAGPDGAPVSRGRASPSPPTRRRTPPPVVTLLWHPRLCPLWQFNRSSPASSTCRLGTAPSFRPRY